MTDAERVEQIYHKSSPDMLTPEGWQFLIKMARIGASVMPRPIGEITPEMQDAYVYYAPDGVWSRGCASYQNGRFVHIGNPLMPLNKYYTHFIPLSALPKPTEVTT